MKKGETTLRGKNTLEGFIVIDKTGNGRVTGPAGDFEVEISKEFLNTAFHGDTVLLSFEKRGEKAVGRVLKVLSRRKAVFAGILKKTPGGVVLEPDDTKLHSLVKISGRDLGLAKIGEKAVVQVLSWGDPKRREPSGKVTTVLGTPGEHNVEMEAILYDRNFPVRFPERVEKEAREAKRLLHDPNIKKRKDFRAVPTFTIDPETAKDFDDAISVRALPSGLFEIGIHIADVTHFVRPGTALDKEAAKRATSVYMVDRTVPMLPEILSNELSSLSPDEEKFTFSAVFTLDENAKVQSEWFGKTIIKSAQRFTYEGAQAVLDAGHGMLYTELAALERFGKKLRAERVRNGSVLFEDRQVVVTLDEKMRPVAIRQKERIETQKLIEDFMLLANRSVAEYIGGAEEKRHLEHFVYRVHDAPNEEKIGRLASILSSLGYKNALYDKATATEINRVLKNVRGKPEERFIQTAMVRSMPKAEYTLKNIGHFGLGFSHYTHFTSPIRRYPDIMVHRLLEKYLAGEKVTQEEIDQNDALAFYASKMERVAEEAERESIKYKQAEYMNERIGKVYDAAISGVTRWGIYAEERETRAEGLIPIGALGDDYFVYDENTYSVVGQRTKKRFRLGDTIRVRVKEVNLRRKQIAYSLA